jgi:hypothetical protein
VPVGVVRAHGDQCHPGAARGEELPVGVPAAVVRHLEHVGRQVDVRPFERRLRLRTQVSGEQHTHPPHGHADDEREVVGLRARASAAGIGSEDVDGRRADGAPLARDEHLALSTHPLQQPVQVAGARVVRWQRPGGHPADVAALQRPGESADVVGVQVRQQHQGQPFDAEPLQAAVHRADVGSGVHEYAAAVAGGHHERIALADVAGHDHGVRWGPAAGGLAQRPPDAHQSHHRGHGQRPQPREPPEQAAEREQHPGQQEGAGGSS